MDTLPHLSGPWGAWSWVDWSLLAVLLVSTLVGAWRGLVYELISLGAWVAAWVAASVWGGAVAAQLPLAAPGSAPRLAAGYLLTFLLVLLLGALLARLLRLLIGATPLRWIDRLLGMVFGAVRGLLLLLVLVTLVTWTPLARSPAWQGSALAGRLAAVVEGLRPLWPGVGH